MAKKQKNASQQGTPEIDHTAQLGSDVEQFDVEVAEQANVTETQAVDTPAAEPQAVAATEVPEPAPRDVPTLRVRNLTREECDQELARLGDPVAERKAARRGIEALIAKRDETLKALNREIGVAEDEYRITFARSQEAAERIRQIKEVQIPALDKAAAAEAAAEAARASALTQNGSEPLL